MSSRETLGRDGEDVAVSGTVDTRTLVQERYLALLRQADSPLLARSDIAEQLVGQLFNVLDTVFAEVGLAPLATSDGDTLTLSAAIGQDRAVAGVHPSDSLHAAGLIFEAALPAVVQALRHDGRLHADEIAAVALNRVIMQRMSVAAEHYIGVLLERIYESNQAERHRISRELHDVVAPAILVGRQNLELYEVYRVSDPVRAADKLAALGQTLTDAVATVRALAAESRQSLSADGVAQAIAQVLARVHPSIATNSDIDNTVDRLPALYREELFLIVQEAIRNAVAHAHAAWVSVTLTMTAHEVRVVIRDDGIGLVRHTQDASSHQSLGLGLMSERASLLGGVVDISSAEGAGVTVSVNVPLPPSITDMLSTADGA